MNNNTNINDLIEKTLFATDDSGVGLYRKEDILNALTLLTLCFSETLVVDNASAETIALLQAFTKRLDLPDDANKALIAQYTLAYFIAHPLPENMLAQINQTFSTSLQQLAANSAAQGQATDAVQREKLLYGAAAKIFSAVSIQSNTAHDNNAGADSVPEGSVRGGPLARFQIASSHSSKEDV